MSDFPMMDRRIAIFEGLLEAQTGELLRLKARVKKLKGFSFPHQGSIDAAEKELDAAKKAHMKTSWSIAKDKASIGDDRQLRKKIYNAHEKRYMPMKEIAETYGIELSLVQEVVNPPRSN